jgi:GTP-binding protein YchF
LFNALSAGQAGVSNYPFTTVDSNIGMVAVPDQRLQDLAQLLSPNAVNPGFVQFIDIAGLVRGASRGEGLGNQFLGNIRSVDAIVHVVRCFEDSQVAHVLGAPDAARDIDIVETELLLADLEVMDRAIEKRFRTWKTSPRQYAAEETRLRGYRSKLAAGVPLRTMDLNDDDRLELKGLGLLTGKPVLYVANLSEEDIANEEHPCVGWIKQSRISKSPTVVTVTAKLESEMQQLDETERREFMEALGIEESGLDRLIRKAYEMLNLITFYTVANNKLSAWAVPRGTRVPEAAGKIHTDMEKGFVRAQIVAYEQILEHRSFQELHRVGLVRTEGKAYLVEDGDVIEILFSP